MVKDALRSVIIAIVVIISLCIVTVAVLTALDKDTSTLIAFIGVLVAATVPNLFQILRIESMAQDVKDVQGKVNGQMSKLVDKIPSQDR